MPSGITSDIYEGKDVSLRDYLMTVGRQMSMAIMQRDDDPREPVRVRKPSTTYLDWLDEAIQERHRLADMTERDAADAAAEEFAQRREDRRKAEQRSDELEARYDSMIAKVQAWEPEESVAYVKKHALKYLRESKEFDCWSLPQLDRMYPIPTEPVPAEEWLATAIADTEDKILRYSELWDEECDRVADFNEHILAFHRSLPDE
jgi:hypothetical protein